MNLLYKKLALLVMLPLLVFLTAACSIRTGSSGEENLRDASVFLSTDRGDNWRPTVSVPTVDGRLQNIGDLNVNMMVMDPQDSMAVYLASFDQGLYYTYNIIKGWNQVAGLPRATISDIKVDPKNKCSIYTAIGNRLYRSQDCARTWRQIYFDNNAEVAVTALAIDHYNSRNVYIGTSRGEIIKSIDYGENWRTIRRLDEGVGRLIISPLDSRQLFVATARNRIFSFTSSIDTNPNDTADVDRNFSVDNWTDLNDVLKDYNLGATFRDIVLSVQDGAIYLATEKLLLRSPDQGITWENIKLLQPEQQASINAVAVNPQNAQDIYYVTNTTFFHSSDGGITWKTKNLPTKRAGRSLLVDFQNPNNIYLGTIKLK